MDLVVGVNRVVAVIEHCAKGRQSEDFGAMHAAITGLGMVNLIITHLYVAEAKQGGRLTDGDPTPRRPPKTSARRLAGRLMCRRSRGYLPKIHL